MGHTYSDILLHVVFSTEGRFRHPLDRMKRAQEYIGGIAKHNGFTAIEVGGVQDHVHALLLLPPTIMVPKAVQYLKGGSSKWFNEQYPNSHLKWQEGYAAFTVSRSNVDAVTRYIRHQKSHHAHRNFQEEYRILLEKHGIRIHHTESQD